MQHSNIWWLLSGVSRYPSPRAQTIGHAAQQYLVAAVRGVQISKSQSTDFWSCSTAIFGGCCQGCQDILVLEHRLLVMQHSNIWWLLSGVSRYPSPRAQTIGHAAQQYLVAAVRGVQISKSQSTDYWSCSTAIFGGCCQGCPDI